MSTDLPASAFRVAIAVLKFLNRETGRCFPSFETLAAATGLSLAGVRKAVSALRKAGFLVTKRSRFNGPLNFEIQLPAAQIFADVDASEQSDLGRTDSPIWDGQSAPFGTVSPPHLGPITSEGTTEEEPPKGTSNVSASIPALPASRPSGCSDLWSSQGPLVVGDGDRFQEDMAIGTEIDLDDPFLERRSETEAANLLKEEDFVRAWLDRFLADRSLFADAIRSAKAGTLQVKHLRRMAA